MPAIVAPASGKVAAFGPRPPFEESACAKPFLVGEFGHEAPANTDENSTVRSGVTGAALRRSRTSSKPDEPLRLLLAQGVSASLL
jgi:hypothetical protein